MNYKKLLGFKIATNVIFDANIETKERAKEIVDKLENVGYLEKVTLIKNRVFTLYDYSTHKGITLKQFLNEK